MPTIVWGFDDASFLYRVQAARRPGSGDTTLTLASAPVDSYHYPAQGQAVELLRDAVQLTATDYIASAGRASSRRSPTAYDPASMKLVICGPQRPADPDGYLSDYIDATPQLYLRVWQATVAAPSGQPIPLGDTGVAVTLSSRPAPSTPATSGASRCGRSSPAIVYPARYLDAPGSRPTARGPGPARSPC